MVALTAFNPWYQLIIIAIAILLWPGDAGGYLRLGVLLRLALILLIVGAVFNAVIVRVGDIVFLQLPESIPVFGGTYTVESVVYGLLNALRLVSIIFAFAVFSRAINYTDLLRLAPAALFELGLILSIGFTLVPSMLRTFSEIREAQTLRGHRPRGVRGLLPLFTPLVVSGMERALTLAEAMETRSYGAVRDTQQAHKGQILALIGLFGLSVTLAVHVFIPLTSVALVLLLALNTALIGFALWLLARGSGRTRLRRAHWSLPETLIAIGGLLPAIVVLFSDRVALTYNVYSMATIGLPPFNPWIGVALIGLIAPMLVPARAV